MKERSEILRGIGACPPCRVYHRFADVNGVRLHFVDSAPQPGQSAEKLVIALHGFPEFWYSWRHQIPALAHAAFRVVAPDLRGYNESEKPKGVASYRVEKIVEDVAGLVASCGANKAHVIGHDWGGGIAWALAIARPQRVERLAILNAPHPAAFARELRRPGQLLKSRYVFFFQLPWLPEMMLRLGNFWVVGQSMRNDPVRPSAFTPADIIRYKAALAQPGALTATINWYRAAVRGLFRGSPRVQTVMAPTLLLWGERDRYLSTRLTEGLENWVPDLRVQRFPDASHWLQHDAPDEVNRALVAFFRGDK